MRGTEVVSDSTNVLVLECARRLRRDPDTPVRLATCQRVVRAQQVPRRPGYSHHFKLFVLATARRQTRDHGFVVDALIEHVRTLLAGFDELTQEGHTFGRRSVRLLATAARSALADRIAEQLAPVVDVVRGPLDHPYYDGLRFMIEVEAPDGSIVPIADGGAFDWLGRLTANRRLVFVASGLGTQLVVLLFRRQVRLFTVAEATVIIRRAWPWIPPTSIGQMVPGTATPTVSGASPSVRRLRRRRRRRPRTVGTMALRTCPNRHL
ncbi:hypothetical protein [Nannocystis exedens]|nr:hypothetical protein [Nannocystis exedens]